ncbi:MAG TPA: hypothetical protein VFN67_20935 [Polyangiales bacterium]|nr:hypothetical protein [Polyangiales bacterium]
MAALVAPISSASAQQTALIDPYFAAKLTLGIGGSATSSFESGSRTYSEDTSLQVSVGVAGQYLYPLHEYFSLGGMLGIQTWRSTGEGDGGRNVVFDLAVLPQGKYVLIPNQLEVNVTIPIGLALDMLNEIDAMNSLGRAAGGAAGGTIEGNTALGLVVGGLVGARYQVLDSFGLLLELGYLFHTVGHTITASAGGNVVNVSQEADVTISWGQFALNVGAYF